MGKVTALLIGDPHFTTNNVQEAEKLIKKIMTLLKDKKPDFVVILGDLLHTHEKIHVVPLKLATRFILEIASICRLYLIIGNHDLCNHSQFLTDNHAFNSFKKRRNITICDKPILWTKNDLKFVGCPYVPIGRFEEALDTLGVEWRGVTCIFAHQEFYGCKLNPVHTSENGDIWPEDYPMVVSGHIHDEQNLGNNIYYTGACMQHSYAENGKKRVSLVTFVDMEKPNILKIDLKMPKKEIKYIDIENVDRFKAKRDTIIKLVVKGEPEELKVFKNSAKYKELTRSNVLVSFSATIKRTEKEVDEQIKHKGLLEILEQLVKGENKYVKEALEKLKI